VQLTVVAAREKGANKAIKLSAEIECRIFMGYALPRYRHRPAAWCSNKKFASRLARERVTHHDADVRGPRHGGQPIDDERAGRQLTARHQLVVHTKTSTVDSTVAVPEGSTGGHYSRCQGFS
jgi:hypothetical protein